MKSFTERELKHVMEVKMAVPAVVDEPIASAPLPVTLLTGFLGSGKTTFFKKYAIYLIDQGLHIAILENDFGAINVDMMVLEEELGDQCELEMVVGGGDLDCHRRRFKTKLISMGMRGFDRILVEPSGIYDVDEFFDPWYIGGAGAPDHDIVEVGGQGSRRRSRHSCRE